MTAKSSIQGDHNIGMPFKFLSMMDLFKMMISSAEMLIVVKGGRYTVWVSAHRPLNQKKTSIE